MSRAFDNHVTILVNSSDGFADCWGPFFYLLDKYWPEHGAVHLNTEAADWPNAPDYVVCTRVALGEGRRLSWSECMLRALDGISTPLVLYMQEDYFIDRPVRHDLVRRAAETMMSDDSIGHIALTRHASLPPYLPYSDPAYKLISPKARYRISTQAALWRKDVLKSYLEPAENGWAFEIFGTLRAHRRHDTFLISACGEQDGGPPIDYVHTGIIKGAWHPKMADVFARNGIIVDFEQRGFYVPPNPLVAKIAVGRKLMEHPGHLVRQLMAW